MVGTVLATRYRIDGVIGEGGMGRVFEGTDEQLGRRVAIKLIRDDLVDPTLRKRFFREARAAAALSHPNICQLYEVGEHETQPFLVMELLQGETLAARLDRARMSKEEVAAILLPLMDALSALHRSGLVHRDLKPSNLFLTEQGVKLLDFGLARRVERNAGETATAVTAPGAVTGTMRYMAPEQITGDPIDARTDIFALGVMLFEMIAGRMPFDAETNVDWLQSVLTEDPPTFNDPDLRVLDPIVSRALQRRPDDRYTQVDQMAADLRAALAGPEVPQEGTLSVVVLPFRLPQADPDIAVLEHGLPEALTAMLSTESDMRIVSNRVAQQFGDAPDLTAVAQALRVDRLLTGSILRAGDDVRVTVQLIDATDGAVRWSQTTEHVLSNVLALQDEVCHQIAAGVLANATAESADVAPEKPA